MRSNINMERTEKVTPFYQQQLAGGVRQQQLAGGVRQQQQQAGLEGVRVPQQDLGYAKEIRYHVHCKSGSHKNGIRKSSRKTYNLIIGI